MDTLIFILVLLALAGWLLSSGGGGPRGGAGIRTNRNCTCRSGRCICR